jgi:leucyl aminopeptidase (aminopeptidase T)
MDKLFQAAEKLLCYFISIKRDEVLWAISDLPENEPGRKAIAKVASDLRLSINWINLPRMTRNGQELPLDTSSSIPGGQAVLAYTSLSLSSTSFRQQICSGNGRFFSLPGGGQALDLLAVNQSDMDIMKRRGKLIKEALEKAKSIQLIWQDANLNIPLYKRKARLDLGACRSPGCFGSPSFEVNIVPAEYETQGSMFVLAALPEIEIFNNPIKLIAHQGKINNAFENKIGRHHVNLQKFVENAEMSMLRIGELGFGLNHRISFPADSYMANESIWGTVHIGIGRNLTLGGSFNASSHIDLVMRPEQVYFDVVPIDQIINNIPLINK